MSEIQVATVASKAAATAPVFEDSAAREIGQLCTAWVNFNGTGTVAIRDSFNISSITDNGAGDYTTNFATAMANANYATNISGNLSSTFAQYLNVPEGAVPSTSAIRMQAANSNTTNTDQDYVFVSIHGGL